MKITRQVKSSILLLAAGAPGRTFNKDTAKTVNAAAAAPSQASTRTILEDVLNSACRTKDVARISEAETLSLAGRLAESQAKERAEEVARRALLPAEKASGPEHPEALVHCARVAASRPLKR